MKKMLYIIAIVIVLVLLIIKYGMPYVKFYSTITGGGSLDSSEYFSDPKVASFVDDIRRGNVKRVQAGLAAGISPNAEGIKGYRPIFFVFFAKEADVLKILLAAGADPNARLSDNSTPLYFSVRNQNLEFTRVLLAAGADPNSRGANNEPPIHEALNQENPGHISLLAEAGADINVVWGGGTPLMSALTIGQWEQARILINLGANLEFKDDLAETALDLACKWIAKIPANNENKQGIAGVVEALARRNQSLPCEAEIARFK